MKTIAVFCVLLAPGIAEPVKDLDLKPEIEGRIAGGMPAAPHQFPYQVGLLLRKDSSNRSYTISLCGGSVISNRVVLTAAHCLYKALDGEVYLGSQSLLNPNVGEVMQNVNNTDFIIHREFDITSYVNDIGLIMLPNEVVFNEYIQPIRLPRPDQVQTVLEGRIATIAGWGKTGDNNSESWDNLLYVRVKILPSKPCEKAYPIFYRTQICISGDNNSTHCHGDSGGPLVVSHTDGFNIVVGVVSGGKREGCKFGFPTVCTKVTSYLDWIARNAGVVPQ